MAKEPPAVFGDSFEIAGRPIGEPGKVFVIAEAGVNHNGDLAQALALVDAAAEAGADAVKFQTFSAEKLVTSQAPTAAYQQAAVGRRASQREMLSRLELSPADHRALIDRCRRRNIVFLSTPFDDASLDLLLSLDVPAIKIGSGDLTDLPLIRRAASSGRPLLLSTGMATLDEVRTALSAVGAAGNRRVVLLHCVTAYPAPIEDANLNALRTLAGLGAPVGYSDHTLGVEAALAAVALGAAVIEKHLTLDKNATGPDHRASLNPRELTRMIRQIRRVSKSLGDGVKRPRPSEEPLRRIARKSLVTTRPLPEGAILQPDMLTRKRPGDGISPVDFERVLGSRLRRPLPADTVIAWDDLTLPGETERERWR